MPWGSPGDEGERALLARLIRSSKDLVAAAEAHRCVRARGFSRCRFLCNLLVQMYSQCGSLDEAERVFSSIDRPNGFSQGIMVSAYVRHGQLVQARCLFDQLKANERDIPLWNMMAQAYAQAGILDEAVGLFEQMPARDVVSWQLLLRCLAQNGRAEDAGRVFNRMPCWDAVSSTSLLVAVAESGDLRKVKELFGSMKERDIVAWNAMLTATAECSNTALARSVFDKAPFRNLVGWTAMVGAYAREGHLLEAHQLYEDMPQSTSIAANCVVQALAHAGEMDMAITMFFEEIRGKDVISWAGLLTGCINWSIDWAREVFDKMPQRSVVPCNAMAQAYAQGGLLQDARTVFMETHFRDLISWKTMIIASGDQAAQDWLKRMPQQDIASWNSAITVYAHQEQFEQVKWLFDWMPHRDVVSWNSIMFAMGQIGKPHGAREAFERSPGWIFSSYNALASAYARNGHMSEANLVFKQQQGRCVTAVESWNSLLLACAQNGCIQESLQTMRAMQLEGCAADAETLTALLAACSHSGTLEAGLQVLDCLVDVVALGVDHYSSLVALLSRLGLLDEAEDLMDGMPFVPPLPAWTTVLGACRLHDDVGRASRLARQAAAAFPSSAGIYNLLANTVGFQWKRTQPKKNQAAY